VALSLDQMLALFQRARDAGLLACDKRFAIAWHLNQVETLLLRGRWSAAQRQLDQAIDLQPTYGPARLLRGELAARLGQWKPAAEDFAVAVSHGESGLSTQCRLAVLLAANGDLNEFEMARQRLL